MATRSQLDRHYDVIVAGARVAGASTAMLLARQGLRVLVVDPVPRGRDTLSTHALMRGGVLQLRRWRLLDRVRAAGTPAITATTFDYGDEQVTIPIKARQGVDALFAPRRTVLDALIVDAAVTAGATVIHGLSVLDLATGPDGRVRGAWVGGRGHEARRVSADFVVGADGVRSKVARLVRAPVEHAGLHATASMYAYWKGLPSDRYRWIFRPATGIGVIPTNGGEACVFVSVRPERFQTLRRRGLDRSYLRTVQSIDPELASAMERGGRRGHVRAFPGIRGFLRRSHGPGWALVGDAGYFKDPLTAHGMTDALRDAELLARAIAAGRGEDLAGYQELRDEAGRGLMEVTDRIASLDWSMEEVKELHVTLAREMNRGVEALGAPVEEVQPVGAPAAG